MNVIKYDDPMVISFICPVELALPQYTVLEE
jgi:hypothetical protein